MKKIELAIRLFFIRYGKFILLILLIIIGIISFVQYLNNLAIEKNEQKKENIITNNSTLQQGNQAVNNTDIKEEPLYKEDKTYTALVQNFIDLCKNNEILNAYELLSDNCKERYRTEDVLYRNYCVERFEQDYDVEIIFEGSSKNIYKIIFKENILHTGKTENLEEIIDYYEIEKDILEKKIYINIIKEKR